MLKCRPGRAHFLQAQDQQVCVRELQTVVKPGPKGVSRGEAPKLSYSTKLIRSFDQSSIVQCLDWSPSGENFVLGFQDGSAVIQSIGNNFEAVNIPARQQRACKSVKYQSSARLAIGHDKVRNDFSITIHDVETRSTVGSFANSESVSSLCWIPGEPHCILAGLNHRWIRMIDTRMQAKDNYTVASIPTTAVYEITANLDSMTFASTCDNNILIWDRRKDDSAILSLKSHASLHSCRVNQLRYNPCRMNDLAALSNDGTVDLWHLQDAHDAVPHHTLYVQQHEKRVSPGRVGFDFVEAPVGFKTAWNLLISTSTPAKPVLLSFDTHRPVAGFTNMSDFLLLDEDRLRFERSPVRGIVEDNLKSSSFPHFMTSLLSDSESSSEEEEDPQTEVSLKKSQPLLSRQFSLRDASPLIVKQPAVVEKRQPDNSIAMTTYFDMSSTMYRRVRLGYGLTADVNKFIVIDSPLKTVWTWIAWSLRASREGRLKTDNFDFVLEGCLNIWNGIGGNPKRSTTPKSEHFMKAVATINRNFDSDIFPESVTQAPLRQMALVSTGWCMTTAAFVIFRDQLIEAGDIAKAAFYSVAQNRDISKAIEVMEQHGIAMGEAVSEYRDARGNDAAARAWREKWPELGIDLDSPYIRAIFAYLSADDWRDVIDEQGLTLRERLSLTLRFVRDEEVHSILQDLCRTEVAEGNLEGLLLTGIKSASLDLLQAYVDRTGDVQTAALIIGLTPDLCSDRRALRWIADYRSFLSTTGLHLQRCRFDVDRTQINKSFSRSRTTVKQVSFRCNHCGAVIDHPEPQETHNSALHESRDLGTRLHKSARHSGTVKSTLCGTCRKALPKCVLCLLPVGSMNLISVCLTCNHTLHYDHAEDWFRRQSRCPAPQCYCECRNMSHGHCN